MIGQAWIQQMQTAAQQQAVYQQTGKFVSTQQAAQILAPVQAALDQKVRDLIGVFAQNRRRAAQQQIPGIVPRFTRWTREPHRQYIRAVIQGQAPAGNLSDESVFFGHPQRTDPYFALRVLLTQDLTGLGMFEAIRRGQESATRLRAVQAFDDASVRSGSSQSQAVQTDLAIMAEFNAAIAQAQATARLTDPTAVATLLGQAVTAPKGVGTDYIHAVRGKVADEMAARARVVFEASAPLRKVVDSIPWPHAFFKSFVYTPLSTPSPFRGVPIWDHEALMEQGYFQLPADRMRSDLARWLARNVEALQEHFRQEVIRWVKEQEAKAKKKGSGFVIVDILLQVFGLVASVLLPGLGSIAAAALHGGWKVLAASEIGKIQKDTLKKILKVLRIAPESLDRFSDWVNQWASKAPAADIYEVKIEGRSVGSAASSEQAGALAIEQSQTGQRIEIISLADGRSSGLLLRTPEAVVQVPTDQEGQVRAMPTEQVQAATQSLQAVPSKGAGFPVWVIPLVGLLMGGK